MNLIIPELGHFALILGFCFAVLQVGLPMLIVKQKPFEAAQLSKSLAYTQLFLLSSSFLLLIFLFVTNNFSVLYVASHSSRELPFWYRFCAVWGAHEGSMLLWVVILSFWTAAVAFRRSLLPDQFFVRVISVLGAISCALLFFILATSNPFLRLFSNIPENGADLNALLQDPGFLLHPPTLYMGYVGFSVPFAFALSALMLGEYRQSFAKWSRPWTLVGWCFLTVGITMGSWWAYRVLGWGGWWFWDPVENASLMPWLVGTALLHSLIVTEKRDAFKGWTILLAIIAFSLSLLGTFLVRSGVLTSVHAFAVDPTRGIYMLMILVTFVSVSLMLYAWRLPLIKNSHPSELLSRETFLMLNNVLLIAAMSTVLLGTLYPLIFEALGFGKLSVGAPYFNTIFTPLMILILFFMGLGPNTLWGKMPLVHLWQRMRWLAAGSVAFALILPWFLTGSLSSGVTLGLALIFWVFAGTLNSIIKKNNSNNVQEQKKSLVKRLQHIKRHQFSMLFAHMGIAVTAVGIVLSHAYSVETQLRMQPGDIAHLGPYQFQFIDVESTKGDNYQTLVTRFKIMKKNKHVSTLQPERRFYNIQQTTLSAPAISSGFFGDLYLALGDPLHIEKQQWIVRAYYKPFIRWIWAGGFMMLFGGLIALTDRRFWVFSKLF